VSFNWSKNGFVYLLIMVAVAVLIYYNFVVPPEQLQTVPISKVASYVKEGLVEKIVVSDTDVTVSLKQGQTPAKVISRKEPGVSLTDTLRGFGVTAEELASVPEISGAQPMA